MRTVFGILAALVMTASFGLVGCIGGLPDASPPKVGNVPYGASPSQGFSSSTEPKFVLPDNLGEDAGDVSDP